MNVPVRRLDPVFGLPTPILFAHRGGAKEVEESTRRGFEHAVAVGTDVLELDVHVLPNGNGREFVVWHGPQLSNVLVDALPDDKAYKPAKRTKDENKIYKWNWRDLKGHAWVANPKDLPPDLSDLSAINLKGLVQPSGDRALLTLDDMLSLFPEHPINIELKESVGLDDIDQFVSILDAHAGRVMLVVSLNPLLLAKFRNRCNGRYPTGFSALGVLTAIAASWFPLNLLAKMDGTLALQTSHDARLTKPVLIRRVRDRGGALHVFLTAFTKTFPAIDGLDHEPTEAALFEVLDRGVDGVMTDRPRSVRKLIDAWLKRPASTPA